MPKSASYVRISELMRKYDLTLVFNPNLKDADRKKLLTTIKDWLGKVKFSKEEEWGQKALAYSIKKEVSGFYVNFSFESDEAIPMDFEKKITAQDKILRHLLLKA